MQPGNGPHVNSIRGPERPLATIDEHTSRYSPGFRDRTQSWKHTGMKSRIRLDLDRHQLGAAAKQEVDLGTVRRMWRPVVQVAKQAIILATRPDQVQNPVFQERTAFLWRNRPVGLFSARTKLGSTQ